VSNVAPGEGVRPMHFQCSLLHLPLTAFMHLDDAFFRLATENVRGNVVRIDRNSFGFKTSKILRSLVVISDMKRDLRLKILEHFYHLFYA
jgi:hypothetical protein